MITVARSRQGGAARGLAVAGDGGNGVGGVSESGQGVGGGGGGAGGAGGLQTHGPDTHTLSDVVSGPALQALNHGMPSGLPQNTDVPSSRPVVTRNSYLERPLPPVPLASQPLSQIAVMAMAFPRPSTSGGLKSLPARHNNFDKRVSKDDMFFSTSRQKPTFNDNRMSRDDTYIRGRMAEMASFHIPIRGQPTPEQSPISNYPVNHEFAIPARIHTPESITSGEIQIGMALGSPSHPPADLQNRWQAQFPPATPTVTASSEPSPALAGPTGDLPQRKKPGGRRKLFGLFGKRKDSETSSYASSTSTLAPTATASTASSVSDSRSPVWRSNTNSNQSMSKHKPIMTRSNTMPYATEEATMSQSGSPEPPPRSMARPGPQQSSQLQAPPSSKPSLLQVDIPDIKLDRYSVMFSGVLNTGQPQPQPASTLLARRQATLDKLKTIEDRIIEKEEELVRARRATSPQPMASPSFSIFPMPPTGRYTPSGGRGTPTGPRKTSPLVRSNTSPGHLPSPAKSTFEVEDKPKDGVEGHYHGDSLSVPTQHGRDLRRSPRAAREEPEPIYPTDTGFHFGPDSSSLILDSPTETDSEPLEVEEILISQPFKPSFQEPQWRMMSPLNSSSTGTSILSSSSTAASQRKRSPSTASSVKSYVTRLSADENEPTADLALRNAVQVSIAKQISVSRQQRHLLRPLQTARVKIGSVASSPVMKTPSPVSKLGKNEPLRETKSGTPTMIHPREHPVNPQSLAQNRKSSWVVLDEA